jgi:hypothetical protein
MKNFKEVIEHFRALLQIKPMNWANSVDLFKDSLSETFVPVSHVEIMGRQEARPQQEEKPLPVGVTLRADSDWLGNIGTETQFTIVINDFCSSLQAPRTAEDSQLQVEIIEFIKKELNGLGFMNVEVEVEN